MHWIVPRLAVSYLQQKAEQILYLLALANVHFAFAIGEDTGLGVTVVHKILLFTHGIT